MRRLRVVVKRWWRDTSIELLCTVLEKHRWVWMMEPRVRKCHRCGTIDRVPAA